MITNNILDIVTIKFFSSLFVNKLIIFLISNNKNQHIIVDFPISEKYMLTYYTWYVMLSKFLQVIVLNVTVCVESNRVSTIWFVCLGETRINEIISLHHNNRYAIETIYQHNVD